MAASRGGDEPARGSQGRATPSIELDQALVVQELANPRAGYQVLRLWQRPQLQEIDLGQLQAVDARQLRKLPADGQGLRVEVQSQEVETLEFLGELTSQDGSRLYK